MSDPAKDVRRALDTLFSSDPQAAYRLGYVIEHAADPEDNTLGFPKDVPGIESGALPPMPGEDVSLKKSLDDATRAMNDAKFTDAFLLVCNALCDWYVQADTAYQERLAVAEQAENKRALERSVHARRLAAPLGGAMASAKELLHRRAIQAEDFQTFSDLIRKFRDAVDEQFPSIPVKRAHAKTTTTDLSKRLIWAFVHIGFDGRDDAPTVSNAAHFASLIAAEHGLKISPDSSRGYARDLIDIKKGGPGKRRQ